MESHLLVVMVSSFPTIQDSCPVLLSSHVTSIAIAVSSCTLSSDRCPLFPLLSPKTLRPCLLGSSSRALLKSGLRRAGQKALGTPMPYGLSSGGHAPRLTPGPLPNLVRETLDTATSPSQLPA